eukprot:16429407-Heterocapsa_arctica.AAC.2
MRSSSRRSTSTSSSSRRGTASTARLTAPRRDERVRARRAFACGSALHGHEQNYIKSELLFPALPGHVFGINRSLLNGIARHRRDEDKRTTISGYAAATAWPSAPRSREAKSGGASSRWAPVARATPSLCDVRVPACSSR